MSTTPPNLSSLSIPSSHSNIALTNLTSQSATLQSLLTHKRLPLHPLPLHTIQHLLLTLSTLDTNTCPKWVGVGEREARIYSPLVSTRHYGFGHGVGRSGDLMESQPKAAGSTALARLTLRLTLDVVRRGAGLKSPVSDEGMLVPLCTGMSMSLILGALRGGGKGECVLWCRIDQKSCFKSILTAGFRVVVIPTILEGDEVVTDLEALKRTLQEEGEKVVAIITTTSCFAPRVPDRVDEIAKVAKESGVAHLINHAYGLQCDVVNKLVTRAAVVGRVDAVVMSMDKNFMVPVGGAIILSPHSEIIQSISKLYAGRASSSPHLDLFITLLSMGLDGYKDILAQRKLLIPKFQSEFGKIAEKYGERMLKCDKNTISFGMTLDTLPSSSLSSDSAQIGKEVSQLGSMLFTRCVSGTRVVAKEQVKVMSGVEFKGFGSSTDDYPHHYLTAACAIGLEEPEMEEFFRRLDKCLKDYFKKREKREISEDVETKENI